MRMVGGRSSSEGDSGDGESSSSFPNNIPPTANNISHPLGGGGQPPPGPGQGGSLQPSGVGIIPTEQGPPMNNHLASSTLISNGIGSVPSSGVTSAPIENNNHILVTLTEKRVITEFCHLLDKSKQLFNQLRELPPHFSTLGASYNPGLGQQIGQCNHHPQQNSQQLQHGGSSNGVSSGLSCQQAYFCRAFDIYTRLWKFQQMHRAILDKKYGLKRWQIGDIASKIGQLYFHYYLRTSQLAYLHEAASFYGAIRARGYYSPHNNRGGALHNNERQRQTIPQSSQLIVKKLRYYARFILVSLLLRKNNVKDLLRELSQQVENYVASVEDEPEEQLEWNLVLSEMRAFIEADSPLVVYDHSAEKLVDPTDQLLILNHRLSGEVVPKNYERLGGEFGGLRLSEIILVGNKGDQLKFSEFTVDMFRMTQTFERLNSMTNHLEGTSSSSRNNLLALAPHLPPSEANHLNWGAGGAGGAKSLFNLGDSIGNPHKYFLYRASIEQILVTLAAAWSELPTPGGIILLYISGDPSANFKGIATHSKYPTTRPTHKNNSKTQPSSPPMSDHKEINCLYPSDLLPLRRKALLVIVDSENSHVFGELGSSEGTFGQPLLMLLSGERGRGCPQTPSQGIQYSSNRGSTFSLFLHSPLAAFCGLCGVKSLSLTSWNQLEHLLNIFHSHTFEQLKIKSQNQGQSPWDVYLKCLDDDFLRLLLLRFFFCQLVFLSHKDFQNVRLRPKCIPEVSLVDCSEWPERRTKSEELILEMADLIQAKNFFNKLS